MFKIFKIRGKRFEYSNNIRAQKLSNPNPNIRDSRKKIRIRIESEYIRSSLLQTLFSSWALSRVCFLLIPFLSRLPFGNHLSCSHQPQLSSHKTNPSSSNIITTGDSVLLLLLLPAPTLLIEK